METVWYLLKNRRYEGPFELADLHVRAQEGQVSPDDYVIEEKNFIKGQMIYRRAAEILPRDAFSLVLSVPEVSEAEAASASAVNSRENVEVQAYRPVPVSNRSFQESVSPVRDAVSRLSFANVMGFCVVVLAAAWLFQSQNAPSDNRQPAEFADDESPASKKQVAREVVRREGDEAPAVETPAERLMPSERPTRSEMVNRSPAPASNRPARYNGEERAQESLNERGLASETGAESERLDPVNLDQNPPSFGEQSSDVIPSDDPPPPFENDPNQGVEGETVENFDASNNGDTPLGGEAY